MMKKFILLTILLIAGLSIYSSVKAYEIGDPDDIFVVNAPLANQKVSGVISISWRMWDDDQSTIQYTAKLFDAATCQNVNYGTINANLSGTSNKTTDNVLSWNTNNTQSSTNLPDGNYCVQVCAAMKNGAANYSACNSRVVKIVNHNHLPSITSNPTNLSVTESGSWSYQVTAYDQDNDPLTYRLVYSTDFIQINSQTGLIQTNGNSKALPAGVTQADYKIEVDVDDGISGSVTQDFNLTVTKDPVVTPPVTNPPTTNPTPTPTPTPTPVPPTTDNTNHPTKIDILYPTDNSILNGTSNAIKWDITDADGLKKIVLEYSKNNDKDWQLIKSLESTTELASSAYIWDVSQIPDDVYYLRISVTDQKGFESNRVSDNFLIQNNPTTTQSEPLIINLQPDSNAVITTNTPKITADFVASNGGKVLTDSIKIIFNDVDITNSCSVAETGFRCTLTQPLEDGKHSVNVTYKDSNNKTASLNWTFTVNTKPQDQTLVQDNITILGKEIPKNSLLILLLLCLVLGILLIIPWFLYSRWKRNKKTQTTTVNNFYPENTPSGSFQELGNYSPGITPILPPAQPAKVEEPVANVPVQDNSQAEIEKNLMDYWKSQGLDQKPFEEIEPVAPAPIEPIQPAQTEPVVAQPEAFQPVPETPAPEISPEPPVPSTTMPSPSEEPILGYQELQPTEPEDSSFQEPTPTDAQS